MISPESFWAGDEMDRKPSSDFLTKYLLANPKIKVLNVNSPWGSGKTFFLTKWAEELSGTHVCIYFNAWETDFSSEPLVALITCIEQQTEEGLVIESLGAKVISSSTNLIKKAAPLIAKGLVKKYIGVDVDALLGDGAGEDLAKGTEELVQSLIEEQSKSLRHVEEFKIAVRGRLETAALNLQKKSPAFIFIDELDRCRPTYAIELLERIKHFFEIEDCRFVIASDSVQLAHSIRAVYGDRFSSEHYLSRFFDAEFRLDNSNMFSIARTFTVSFSTFKMGVIVGGFAHGGYGVGGTYEPVYPRFDTVHCKEAGYTEYSLVLVGLARFFKIQLRELIRYHQQIISMSSALPVHDFHYFWAAFLIFSKASGEELYSSLFQMDRCGSVVAEFAQKTESVSFSFAEGVVPLKDIAAFYARLAGSDKEAIHKIRLDASGWQETVARDFYSSCEYIFQYRKLVELAHRLS
ncbi:P-loop NTPase fold protein [Pseudomonas fragi]|uniref:KAP family P-loop NTPase fold protein n=1 Tax=Pseudomonas fragi TaxID=296 RepID=UPI00309606AD